MSFGITFLLIMLMFFLNIIISSLLIKKHNLAQKIISELKSGVQNLINDLGNHIALAEDVKTQLALLIRQASQPSNVSKKQTDRKVISSTSTSLPSTANTAPQIKITDQKNSDSAMVSENITLINLLIDQGATNSSITSTLNVSLEEINLVKSLRQNAKKSQKKK